MNYLALATDYDGTLAEEGRVSQTTLDALQRWQATGRKLFLVTGRHLGELCNVFPQVDWFDCIVAENGALLYFPKTKEEKLLGDRPPESFIQELQRNQVEPIDVGRVIVSTWEPHGETVLETIRKLGLELQVILNKDAVMILPSGIDKATGLSAVLARFDLSPQVTIAVGDAENDCAFMEVCGFSVAVANALPMVKERADWVTNGSRGDGVVELIDRYS